MFILDFFANPWVQLIMWSTAAFAIFRFRELLKGSGDAWLYIAIGVFLIGLRIGYKIMPFYQSSEFSQSMRFIIGIIGIIVLFIGLIKYYYNNLKPLIR